MWHPFSDFDRTFVAMNELWSRLERPRSAPRDFDTSTTLLETPTGYEFRVDMPGVAERDIEVDLHEQTLTLAARRSAPSREGWSVHRAERQGFEWKRSFTFPAKLDRERVSAKLENGVLTIRLARVPEVEPRKVTVTVA